MWKLGMLPLGLITYYILTHPLERSWHVLGRYDPVHIIEIENADVVHYNGNYKLWLDLAIGKFNESVSELLLLSVTLDPRKSFNADDICKLVTKYYPLDFTEQERIEFRLELQHYKLDNDPRLKNVSSLSELCRGLQITEKSEMYPLIDRLVRLILTLPVSNATSERAFSKMKLVKTRLRSTMSDDFLKSSMILSIEREIVGTLCTEKMIDDFYSKSQRRVQMMKKRKVSS
ncbi:hypothetical protein CTI12_AA612080 [Artemisia annua]|uniref:Hexosyltransferase n=1 Tax=Artemisia annua TaxID=35608 RepID=A0A2U1KEY7_ARTAN|nr:hypothetical protein CTI12_AA612080 [Artemisia annua]